MEIKLKNKGYIFFVLSFAMFGLAGMFLVPVVILIIKISKRYPKVFTWITIVAFSLMCIYLLIVEQEWNLSFLLMCIAVAIGNVLDTKNR